MAQSASEIRYLLDRAAIHDLLTRYFQGLDRGSAEQVRGCFTADVQAHYDKRTPTRGLDAMMDSLQNFNKLREETMKITTHCMGNLNITRIEGDAAETETNALALLVEPKNGADVVLVRSLRYLDRLRREESGWRISNRIHTLDWSCEVPASFAITLTQRISNLPLR